MEMDEIPEVSAVNTKGNVPYPRDFISKKRMLLSYIKDDLGDITIAPIVAFGMAQNQILKNHEARAEDEFEFVEGTVRTTGAAEADEVRDLATAESMPDCEKTYSAEIQKLNADISKKLHESLCMVGSFTAGKKKQSSNRELGSGTSDGFVAYSYIKLLQSWLGVTCQCDCGLKDVFQHLKLPDRINSVKTLGLGFGSLHDKEAHIRGITITCGETHTFARPLPGLGVVGLTFRAAQEMHSAGFSQAVIQNLSAASMSQIMRIWENQFAHSTESGYCVTTGLKSECVKVLQIYKAYLDASGRKKNLEAIAQMPSLSMIGVKPGAKDNFMKTFSAMEKSKYKHRQSEGTLEQEYSRTVDETVETATRVTARLTAIRSLYQNLPSSEEIKELN